MSTATQTLKELQATSEERDLRTYGAVGSFLGLAELVEMGESFMPTATLRARLVEVANDYKRDNDRLLKRINGTALCSWESPESSPGRCDGGEPCGADAEPGQETCRKHRE